MTEIQKFYSDAQRIVKHERANNVRYDAQKACSQVASLFIKSTNICGDLPTSCVEYWMRTFIENSSDIENEPTLENLEKLTAILAFLQNTDEYEDVLSDEDWRMLGELVNYEAADLPIEDLQNLMAIIVSKGAL